VIKFTPYNLAPRYISLRNLVRRREGRGREKEED